jgi:hypothetical protein
MQLQQIVQMIECAAVPFQDVSLTGSATVPMSSWPLTTSVLNVPGSPRVRVTGWCLSSHDFVPHCVNPGAGDRLSLFLGSHTIAVDSQI